MTLRTPASTYPVTLSVARCLDCRDANGNLWESAPVTPKAAINLAKDHNDRFHGHKRQCTICGDKERLEPSNHWTLSDDPGEPVLLCYDCRKKSPSWGV